MFRNKNILRLPMVKRAAAAGLTVFCSVFLSVGSASPFATFAYADVRESELIDSDEISGESVNYSSEAVVYGDLKTSPEAEGELYYPKQKTLVYTGDEACFVRLICGRSGSVKAGDKLVELKINVDDIAVEEKELALARVNAQYEADSTALQESLDEVVGNLYYNFTSIAGQKLRVQAEKLQLQLELLEYEYQLDVARMQDELDELYKAREPYYITAPISGEISSVITSNPGDPVHSGDVICTITDESVTLIRCDGTRFNYGADAVVSYGDRSSRSELAGEVIVSSSVIPDSDRVFSYIGMNEAAEGKLINISVSSDTTYIQNVLLVPNSAKTNESDLVYVTLVDDTGALHKRRIRIALTGKTCSWVIDGLNEGDTVIKGRR